MAGKWKSFAQHHRLFRLPGRLGDPRRRPDQRRVASIAEHARHGRRPTHVAHVVAEDTGLTMVIPMQNEFKKAYPAAAERFLRAHKEALLYAAAHREQANAWFSEAEVARQLSRAVVEKTTAYDPPMVGQESERHSRVILGC
jgi:hypothetical protein